MTVLHLLDLAHRIGWPPIAITLTAALVTLVALVGLYTADGGTGRHVRPGGVPRTPHRPALHHHAAAPRHAHAQKAAAA